jgi:hypothetical protein
MREMVGFRVRGGGIKVTERYPIYIVVGWFWGEAKRLMGESLIFLVIGCDLTVVLVKYFQNWNQLFKGNQFPARNL